MVGRNYNIDIVKYYPDVFNVTEESFNLSRSESKRLLEEIKVSKVKS